MKNMIRYVDLYKLLYTCSVKCNVGEIGLINGEHYLIMYYVTSKYDVFIYCLCVDFIYNLL